MTQSQTLNFTTSQSLVLTPQLQLAIKLLQLSNQELSQYLYQELEQNPFLHIEENPEHLSLEAMKGEEQEKGPSPFDIEKNQMETMWDDAPYELQGVASVSGESSLGLENIESAPVSLRDYLMSQLYMSVADPLDQEIGIHLIDMLDEAGYLQVDFEALALVYGVSLAHLKTLLQKLQQFEPAGIFARDLKECLSLQLKELNQFDPRIQSLLDNLELITENKFSELLKICHTDPQELNEMISDLRKLNPKPAWAFDKGRLDPIIPDILLSSDGRGGWVAELNPETLPKVLVNQGYYTYISNHLHEAEGKEYLSKNYTKASWLVKALHQRSTTVLKVTTAVLEHQQAFLTKGITHLQPLTLKEIAEVVGMHESTISRVTSNKFMATPRGVYPLKIFFTSSLAGGEGGQAHGASSVRYKIKSLIDTEPKADPFSDDRLVEILESQGIKVARRTVAKYRKVLNIPSSVERKRFKNPLSLVG